MQDSVEYGSLSKFLIIFMYNPKNVSRFEILFTIISSISVWPKWDLTTLNIIVNISNFNLRIRS
jgi:hypothetical protein